MQTNSDGSYSISDVVSIDGTGESPFVFGRGWLLEILTIEAGDFYFYRDSQKIEPRSNRFGAFYPPFSFVRSSVRNLRGTVKGVGNTEVLPGLPEAPVIFETDFKDDFTSANDALDVIASARNLQSIVTNTEPSLISI